MNHFSRNSKLKNVCSQFSGCVFRENVTYTKLFNEKDRAAWLLYKEACVNWSFNLWTCRCFSGIQNHTYIKIHDSI